MARFYLDLNRAEDDLDPAWITGAPVGALQPGSRALAGHGLIRTLCRGQPVYAAPLSWEQAQQRISAIYHPYHVRLAAELQQLQQSFGTVWHLNCHSMPSAAYSASPSEAEVDFVVGDRNGTTAKAGFVQQLLRSLRGMGYRVAYNHPYRGVEIVRRCGQPQQGRHSVQLEINRALYMDEATLTRGPGFAKLQTNLQRLLFELGEWIMQRLPTAQAAE